MKNKLLLLILLVLLQIGNHVMAQTVTLHESTNVYLGTDGPYSCTPDANKPVSLNMTYTYSAMSRWLGGYNPTSEGRPAYYSASSGDGYLVYLGVCTYRVSPFTIWWNGVGWVIGYQGQEGPNSFLNSIALFNGLNTAKPPCKGWPHGYLSGDCIDAKVTVWTPEGAPDLNAGAIASTGVINGKNAYEIPVTGSSNGAKATINWNGTQWVVTYVDPAGRTMAETILSTNATDAGSNPPCTGWSNGYSLAGAICEGGATGVLPVSLVSFKAESADQKTVQLKWETAQERNSLFYGIERSKDMSRFEEFAKVQAAGTANEMSHYTLTDETPLKGRSYYRLRQVDMDGTETVYRAVTIRTSGTDSPFPNPTANGAVHIEATDNAVIKLTDLSGRNLDFVRKRINDEVVELTPRQRLQPGTYVITKDGQSYKLIVE